MTSAIYKRARILRPFLIVAYAACLAVPFVSNPFPLLACGALVGAASYYLKCPTCGTNIFNQSPNGKGIASKAAVLLAKPSQSCQKCGYLFRDARQTSR